MGWLTMGQRANGAGQGIGPAIAAVILVTVTFTAALPTASGGPVDDLLECAQTDASGAPEIDSFEAGGGSCAGAGRCETGTCAVIQSESGHCRTIEATGEKECSVSFTGEHTAAASLGLDGFLFVEDTQVDSCNEFPDVLRLFGCATTSGQMWFSVGQCIEAYAETHSETTDPSGVQSPTIQVCI